MVTPAASRSGVNVTAARKPSVSSEVLFAEIVAVSVSNSVVAALYSSAICGHDNAASAGSKSDSVKWWDASTDVVSAGRGGGAVAQPSKSMAMQHKSRDDRTLLVGNRTPAPVQLAPGEQTDTDGPIMHEDYGIGAECRGFFL